MESGLPVLVIVGILLIGIFVFGLTTQRLAVDVGEQTPVPAERTRPAVTISPTPTILAGPVPETFIVDGPQEGRTVEVREVEFRFSGVLSGADPRDLQFETKLEGVDENWQSSFASSRTVRLLSGPRSYTFFVRTKTQEGVVDPIPASRTFFANLSPLLGEVLIGSINAGWAPESITLRNNSSGQAAIDVSGWRIRSRNEEIIIPQAVRMFERQSSSVKEPIRLERGERLVIYTGPGSPGENLKLNRCVGYLNSLLPQPSPLFSTSCPRPSQWEIASLSQKCQDFLNNLRACEVPQSNEPKLLDEPACRSWIQENLSYHACVQNHQRDLDFFEQEWRVWLGFNRFIFGREHDNIRLYDAEGRLVDRRDY
ncbi:MAG: hypothetical protein HYW80_01230 [Parcubacteria group bacterium]|nr:hypothetical protein [Parcubacteria group bacterium]